MRPRRAVGSRVPRDRYGNTTSTLKNLYAGFPPAGTSPHGPSSIAAPFTLYVAGTFHRNCGGSNTMCSKSGVPSAFIGKDTILKSFVATL